MDNECSQHARPALDRLSVEARLSLGGAVLPHDVSDRTHGQQQQSNNERNGRHAGRMRACVRATDARDAGDRRMDGTRRPTQVRLVGPAELREKNGVRLLFISLDVKNYIQINHTYTDVTQA